MFCRLALGGVSSQMDSPRLPGLQGSSYNNSNFAEHHIFKQHEPFLHYHPDGWIEITEVPPPCACGQDDRPCRWLDGNYTDFECMCDQSWVPKHQLYRCDSGKDKGASSFECIHYFDFYGNAFDIRS